MWKYIMIVLFYMLSQHIQLGCYVASDQPLFLAVINVMIVESVVRDIILMSCREYGEFFFVEAVCWILSYNQQIK